jgi:hypothetical protein
MRKIPTGSKVMPTQIPAPSHPVGSKNFGRKGNGRIKGNAHDPGNKTPKKGGY